MQKICEINQSVNRIVLNKNNPFMMIGQSISEWVRQILVEDIIGLPDEKQYNFVPHLSKLRSIERQIDEQKQTLANESKLTNIMSFNMSVFSIFGNKPNTKPNPDEEKEIPDVRYYIGNLIDEEIKTDLTDSDIQTIVAVDTDLENCNSSHDDLNNWKQPSFAIENGIKFIKAKSSHYIYLGYLYIIALAWQKNYDIYLLENLTLDMSVTLLTDFVKDKYADIIRIAKYPERK